MPSTLPRTAFMASVVLQVSKSVTFRWQMYSEDASSPEGDFGTITLNVPA
jgi:hypothetical protein